MKSARSRREGNPPCGKSRGHEGVMVPAITGGHSYTATRCGPGTHTARSRAAGEGWTRSSKPSRNRLTTLRSAVLIPGCCGGPKTFTPKQPFPSPPAPSESSPAPLLRSPSYVLSQIFLDSSVWILYLM